MYLYVKHRKEILLFSDIRLKDGYKPVVGSSEATFQLEPSIWFKIYAIDSILVDCNERKVKWSRQNDASSRLSEKDRIGKPFREQLQVLEFDNILYKNADFSAVESEVNELFYAANDLFTENTEVHVMTIYVGDEPVIISADQTAKNTEVLRMLHCYILPMVCFSQKDENALKMAINRTEHLLEKTQEEISELDNQIIKLENTLSKQRERILEKSMEEETLFVSDNAGFFSLLLKHVSRDISVLSAKLEGIQTEVNRLKKSGVKDDDDVLLKARAKRDEFHLQMTKVLMFREDTLNETVRSNIGAGKGIKGKRKSRKNKKANEEHSQEMYMEVCMQLNAQKDNMHKLILRQVCISYMRESIHDSLLNLQNYGRLSVSDGFLMKSNIVETDDKPKEWKTIREIIAEIIQNSDSEGYLKHEHFCNIVITKIDGSLNELSMFSPKKMQPQLEPDPICFVQSCKKPYVTQHEGNESAVCQQNQEHENELEFDDETFNIIEESDCSLDDHNQVEVRDSLRNSYSLEAVVNTLKQMIVKHIEEMCQYLSLALPENTLKKFASEVDQDKLLWLCYEPLIFEQIGPKLVQLYERTYSKKSRELHRKLKECKIEELIPGLENVFVDDNVANTNAEDHNLDKTVTDTKVDEYENEQNISFINERNIEKKGKKCAFNKHKSVLLPSQFREPGEQLTIGDLYRGADSERVSKILHGVPSIEIDPMTVECECSPTCTKGNRDSWERADLVNISCAFNQEHNLIFPDKKDFKERFDRFKAVIECFEACLKDFLISKKIKNIARGLEKMDEIIKRTANTVANADNILELVIFLLINMSEENFSKLHAHLNLMTDMAPKFLSSNMYVWSLAQLQMAYYYLFDQQILNLHRNSRDCDELDHVS